MSDLYSILGVERGASAEDIKKAYKREALKNHPDRGGDKDAFQRLGSAYDVLSDPDKRGYYDATGQIPGAEGSGGFPGGGFPGGGFPGGIDISQIFGQMFGSGFGPSGPGHQVKAKRGPNKLHEIGVSMADLYSGKQFKLNMKRDVLCDSCKGQGGSHMESCGACGGKGMRIQRVQMGPMTTIMNEACGVCQQTGQRVVTVCDGCKGKRVVERETVLDVRVEPGMQDGDRIVFPGQCSESPAFESPGDVILVVRAASTDPAEWVRKGADLSIEIRLTMVEAMLGWSCSFTTHPSGKELRLAWKEGAIRDGEVLRVPGWGMPKRGASPSYGELRLVCKVEAQGAWSETQRRALRSVWPDWVEPSLDGMEVPLRS